MTYPLYVSCVHVGDGSYTVLFNVLQQKRVTVLRKVLEGDDDGGVAAVRKAIDLYQSCINSGATVETLVELINHVSSMSVSSMSHNIIVKNN